MKQFFLFAVALVFGTGLLHAAEAPASLGGVAWTLRELNGKPAFVVPEGRGAPTIRFSMEKRSANGFSGINQFVGGFETRGDTLKFGPLASTRMAGPPDAMEAESAFLKALGETDQWRIAEGMLELLHGGKVVARFAGVPAAAK